VTLRSRKGNNVNCRLILRVDNYMIHLTIGKYILCTQRFTDYSVYRISVASEPNVVLLYTKTVVICQSREFYNKQILVLIFSLIIGYWVSTWVTHMTVDLDLLLVLYQLN